MKVENLSPLLYSLKVEPKSVEVFALFQRNGQHGLTVCLPCLDAVGQCRQRHAGQPVKAFAQGLAPCGTQQRIVFGDAQAAFPYTGLYLLPLRLGMGNAPAHGKQSKEQQDFNSLVHKLLWLKIYCLIVAAKPPLGSK